MVAGALLSGGGCTSSHISTSDESPVITRTSHGVIECSLEKEIGTRAGFFQYTRIMITPSGGNTAPIGIWPQSEAAVENFLPDLDTIKEKAPPNHVLWILSISPTVAVGVGPEYDLRQVDMYATLNNHLLWRIGATFPMVSQSDEKLSSVIWIRDHEAVEYNANGRTIMEIILDPPWL